MDFYSAFIAPFDEQAFMRRALVACFALAIGGSPLGVFLTLRRLTLVGDAMSHALLPGIVVALLLTGGAFGAMTTLPIIAGSMGAGLLLAALAAALTRLSSLPEDAAFGLITLSSLAGGIVLLNFLPGRKVDLMHFLFGHVLAVSNSVLYFSVAIAALSVVALAVFYRHWVISTFDNDVMGLTGWQSNLVFLCIVMFNLIAAFQSLGTLMALGLMILPALAARFWTSNINTLIILAISLAAFASWLGLVLAWSFNLPAGAAVVLIAGGMALLSSICGREQSIISRYCNMG